MLTSCQLWLHSPDRHQGVDVVCSNRSLGLESISSVVNEWLLIPQVHQRKKKERQHWRPQRTAEKRFRRSTMHPLACSSIDRRRRQILLIHSSLSGIIRQLNASEISVFWICSSSVPTTWGGRASCLETERKSTGMKKKALGSTLASSGEEKRPSIKM